ncbi:MAG: AAA family ATPase [Ruminococcus sp.]|nr:AAA family ATPase [Ruminococcus sp.]
MIDLNRIEKYRENNRIEAKKAAGGLPNSIWETYSSFANTLGGVILLGVTEDSEKQLQIFGLSDPEKLIKDFWDNINNSQKVSVNIISDKNVAVEDIEGKKIIVIAVPRAQRCDKPVYISGNPLSGTYRRNGEGDYKCSQEEVKAMLRDAAVRTQDMLVLGNMRLDVFDYDSVHRYRNRMKNYRPGHVWEELDDVDFLYKLGAVGRDDNGELHPTAAGLLMFGYEYEIVKEYPDYFLDYQEQFDPDNRWTDRIVSSSGDWSGNIYDFYFRVFNKLKQSIKVPFKIENGVRIEDMPVHKALREAIANCLINADYYGKRGVVITQTNDNIKISNPGSFRIGIDEAKAGGVSDPRNTALMKMFNLIDIGERAGSGIPNIYSVWTRQNMTEPEITEAFEPERVTLSLRIKKIGDNKSAIKIVDKKSAINETNKQRIIEYLKDHISAGSLDIADYLGLKSSRTRDYLNELIAEDVVVSEGGNKNRKYKLKT